MWNLDPCWWFNGLLGDVMTEVFVTHDRNMLTCGIFNAQSELLRPFCSGHSQIAVFKADDYYKELYRAIYLGLSSSKFWEACSQPVKLWDARLNLEKQTLHMVATSDGQTSRDSSVWVVPPWENPKMMSRHLGRMLRSFSPVINWWYQP